MKSKTIYWIIAIIVVVSGLFFISSRNSAKEKSFNGVPQQPIHWHPHLMIVIKGEEHVIPTGIGINIGNDR